VTEITDFENGEQKTLNLLSHYDPMHFLIVTFTKKQVVRSVLNLDFVCQ